ncbi:5'-nucleotidase C-terminal domain-containing protein [Paenibacillus polysaccharolyticus]|uniref:5'-nucleotidase C-terminal domain-containing protein n=1 Tax=Paenibacillus polysaccharolyticus TaxID=582692 RepID=UPI0020400674|nr:5'-nucleotidase C-terminal domain-containing protein [Paenibacillus polysaccharolyticus]MCM3135285.1 5'-nucleotidase C-terminal domain-containing protein [Paenibacillus polysaccharolyticus]
MKNWKNVVSLLLTVCLLFGSVGIAAAATDSAPGTGKHITILHTNDMHARAVEQSPAMGFAKVAGIVDKYRSENPNTLLLDAGDAVHGTTFATLVRGESIVQVMNEIGYQAMVPGNHEFNYGSERLMELAKMMKFPMLSANVKKKDGTRIFEPYLIKEVDGVKIGIIALTTPETMYKTNPKNVEGLQITDPSAEAKVLVNEIRSKVDVVVVLGHLGQDVSSTDTSFKVVKEVPGIDVFIDGHSHTVLKNGLVSDHGTLIASAGEYTNYVGVIDLWVDGGKVSKKTATLMDETGAKDIKPNGSVATLVSSIQKKQEPILKEEVANTAVLLDGKREQVRAGETNLGDLLADAIRDVSKADIALTNGGGIRSSIEKGIVTKGDVITVLPFGNQVVTLDVKGSDILAALENGVGSYPEPSGGFPQVSGITFKIDATATKGSRVHSVMVGDKALDPTATYTLATNDFTAVGGDEYTMFAKYSTTGMYGALDEALINYMQKLGAVDIKADGRISEGKKTAVEPEVPGTEAPAPIPVPTKPQPEKPKPEKPIKPAPGKPAPSPAKLHIVKSGESLYSISKQYGTTWQKLQQLNKIKNPHWIYPGQTLKLPAAS